MNVLILAPHQDDEVLSSYYLMLESIEKGDEVFVVFATNGDYIDVETARVRYAESVENLLGIGVKPENILYMGYSDTGMEYPESFICRLYFQKPGELLTAPFSDKTYHPAGGVTVHKFFTGEEAEYTRNRFLDDLCFLIKYIQPGLVILPYLYDAHGDHRGLSLFYREALAVLDLAIPTYQYLIHAGDDLVWPSREEPVYDKPESVSVFDWKKRIVFPAKYDRALKEKAIRRFESQDLTAFNNYLPAFAKEEEFYFPFD